MKRWLPVELPPSQPDIAISRLIRRHATPVVERAGKVLTVAADEKPLLAAALLYWLYNHGTSSSSRRVSRADHIMACVAISAALPHLLKLLVKRQRPDRKLMHGLPRHGIPHSGDPTDSFPSGHAMHLGSIAAALTRTAGAPVAANAWIGALGLSATRLLLLAHYVSDVLAGLALGAAIEWLVAGFTKPSRTPEPRQASSATTARRQRSGGNISDKDLFGILRRS
jgi:undecaprenyl-diphosphatase